MPIERAINTAIVTGPTGAVGAALCERLAGRGICTYAVVRPDSSRMDRLRQVTGIHIIECDVTNLGSLPERIHDLQADAFFHLAWMGTVGAARNNMPLQVENIRCALDAVHAASAMGCKVFIGAGSQAEYGRVDCDLAPDTPCFPETGYGMAKLCAGEMTRAECAKLGLDHVWPRILSVYGPRDGAGAMVMSTITKLLGGERPALTAGEQVWDYLYADDAAEAMYLMALHGRNGAVYPLGSGQGRPLREYMNIMRDAIDPSLPLGFGEVPYGTNQVMYLKADISALREDTGFEPLIDFEVGIRKTIDWVRKQHG